MFRFDMRYWRHLAVGALTWAALGATEAGVVGWMGGHSIEPQIAGFHDTMRWTSWDDYAVLPQVSMSLVMAASDAPYSPLSGQLPDPRYVLFADMNFSAANVGHTWRVERDASNAADFDGAIGRLSNGRIDWMLWAFEGRMMIGDDVSGFAAGSLPMYGYYHFQGDLAGKRVEWMSLTLESYTQWLEPNRSFYCQQQYVHCSPSNNLAFTYWLVFGNNDPVPMPQPATAALVGLGVVALAVMRRRRMDRDPRAVAAAC